MNQAKDLFYAQTELIGLKVNMAANRAIDRVVDQIIEMKGEMNQRFTHIDQRFSEMDQRFVHMGQKFSHLESRISTVEHRVAATEVSLNTLNSMIGEIRTKFIDYSFKAGWILLAAVVSSFFIQLHGLIK